MKEIYYDYLQSEPRSGKTSFGMLGVKFEDVMNLPIEHLKLQGKLKELFVDKPCMIKGTLTRIFTIGDLVNAGYDSIKNCIYKYIKSGQQVALYNLQVALAKFSLKLKDSDFMVFDIDAYDAGLTSDALDWADENELITLGDFYFYANQKLKMLSNTPEDNKIKRSVIKAAKRFGVTFEKNNVITIRNTSAAPKNNLGIFPDILNAFKNESQKKSNSKKHGSKISNLIGLEIFDNVDYSNTACDYTGLIKLIKLHFRNLSDFMNATNISRLSIEKIVKGEELADKTLKKAYNYFNVSISSIVKNKTNTIKRNENTGVGTKYDFSQAFVRIRNLYGSRSTFQKVSGISDSAIDSLAKGNRLSAKNMQKLCKALRCNIDDIVKIIPKEIEETKKEEENIYYDYTKLKNLLNEHQTSLNKIFIGNGSRHHIGNLISSGKALNERYLNIITSSLNCQAKDLYEIKTGENPFIECDYSKLKALLDKNMISVSRLCKETGLASNEILNKMQMGKHLGQEKLNRIAAYFGLKEEDIVTNLKSREEVKENKRQDKIKREPEVDYSKLFEKLKEVNLTLDELINKLKFANSFKSNIRRNIFIGKRNIIRLCHYFNCEPQELFSFNENQEEKKTIKKQGSNSSAKKSSKKGGKFEVCDYTELLKIIYRDYKSPQHFTNQAKIPRDYVVRINKGQLLDFTIYKKISSFLNKPIDDFVKFKNSSDREKIFSRITEIEENEKNKEVDYSKLYQKLSELGLNDSDLYKNKIVSFNIVCYKIRQSKEISTDTVERICSYLNCKPNDIFKRLKPKNPTKKSCKPKNPTMDYSYLLLLVDRSFLNLTKICREVGVPIFYAHEIMMGVKIARDKLEKICEYLKCDPDIVCTEIKKENNSSEIEQRPSFVNTNYGGGVARVKPAFKNDKETSLEVAQTDSLKNDISNNVVAGGQGKNPKDSKFYCTSNGFVKYFDIKFRKHFIKNSYNYLDELENF